jgi:NAD(P)-dependent dehydrogenase (short-subunit alcohol dehydrogenase family)
VLKVVETAREAYGPVKVLVSNVGFLQQQPFVDLIVEDFDRMISIYSRGTFLCIHAVLPEMLSMGRRSRRKVRGV